jgi:hypothetical protein
MTAIKNAFHRNKKKHGWFKNIKNLYYLCGVVLCSEQRLEQIVLIDFNRS